MADWHALAELAPAERAGAVRTELATRGLEALAEGFAALLDRPEMVVGADGVLAALDRAGDPLRAFDALLGCVEGLERTRLNGAPVFVEAVLTSIVDLAGASGRFARLLRAEPTLALEVALVDAPIDARPALAATEVADFDRRLRRLRNRHMLRIARSELLGADLRESARAIADLASTCLDAALEFHRRALVERYGAPEPPCAAAVIGMGKLGGQELNFSSDIDLIFFYEHDEGAAGSLSMHELHVKLFERVTRSMSALTEDGFVFRVDAALRPEGNKGPLANSLASAERYYQTWGRTWERAAWIRARPVAGEPRLGAEILEMMRPFVYRKAFGLEAIEAIIAMKDRIDRERRGREAGVDLKLGSGGIREIEFFVQAHQLLHGGKNKFLREPNTIEALRRLEAAGIVSARVAELLADAYLALRALEHRIQIVEDRQTHSLPVSSDELEAIARSFGRSGARLLEELELRMGAVHAVFRGLASAARDEEPRPAAIEVALEAEGPARAEALAALGVRDLDAALAALDALARLPASPFHPRASTRDAELAGELLFECWRSPDVDRALRHLPALIRRTAAHREWLLRLENPSLRRGVTRVLGTSDLLSRILVSDAELLPLALAGGRLRGREELEVALRDRLAAASDDEDRLEVLRAAKQEETLRIAIADLAEELDLEAVGARLAVLAEVLLEAVADMALASMVARYGAPMDGVFVLVAGGTLGAREIGYRSDLDLSVIFSADGETSGGPRGRVSHAELFTRVAQRLLQLLTLRTARGELYPVDMRLRPSGRQGALVIALDRFRAYHETTAQLWERQALLRSRVVAGDRALGREVDAAIERAAYAPGPVADGAARIRQMRDRIAAERGHGGGPRRVDLKLGPGGLVELEFWVQHLLITHGADPALRTPSTREALRRLADAGHIPRADAERLLAAHARLRRVQNWLRVAHDEMIDVIDFASPSTRPLALAVGYRGSHAEQRLHDDLVTDTGYIHRCYTEGLGG